MLDGNVSSDAHEDVDDCLGTETPDQIDFSLRFRVLISTPITSEGTGDHEQLLR